MRRGGIETEKRSNCGGGDEEWKWRRGRNGSGGEEELKRRRGGLNIASNGCG